MFVDFTREELCDLQIGQHRRSLESVGLGAKRSYARAMPRMGLGATIAPLLLLLSCTGGEDPGAASSGCAQEVVVYLHPGATMARQAHVRRLIEAREEVDRLHFNSPRAAYLDFQRAYRGQPEVYKDRSASDFPASFEVTLVPGASFSTFNEVFSSTEGVDKLVPGPCRAGGRG